MELTVNVYLHSGDKVEQKLDSILGFLTAATTAATLERKQIMATLQEAADTIDGLTDLVQQTHAKIDDLQAEIQKLATQDPDQQALIDRIKTKAEALRDGLTAAINDNDPALPGSTPEPTPTTEPAPESLSGSEPETASA